MPASDPSGPSSSNADRPTLTPRMAALIDKGAPVTADDVAQLTAEDRQSLLTLLRSMPAREMGQWLVEYQNERQCENELQMLKDGRPRYESSIRKAREKGYESQTTVGQRLLWTLLTPAAEALARDIEDARTGKAGKNCLKLHRYLDQEDPFILMKIVLEVAIDSFARPDDKPQAVILRVAERVEDHQRARGLYEHCRALSQFIDSQTQGLGEGAKRHRHRRIVNAMNKADVPWTPWTPENRRALGKHLLQYLQNPLGLIELQRWRYGKRLHTRIQPTQDAIDWMAKSHEAMASFAAVKRPMVAFPAPWEDGQIKGGGYLFQLSNRDRIVRSPHGDQMKRLEVAQMPAVPKALTVLQWTGWRINRKVLKVTHGLPSGAVRAGDDGEATEDQTPLEVRQDLHAQVRGAPR